MSDFLVGFVLANVKHGIDVQCDTVGSVRMLAVAPGCLRCRHGDPNREDLSGAEDDDPKVQLRWQAGHYSHADARVHDQGEAAHVLIDGMC
jgi:hypothetical protein